MTRDDGFEVDGAAIRFVVCEDGTLTVMAGEAVIGALEPLEDGVGYTARQVNGEPLTRASQWGGRVTARFGSRELAVRALLEP